MMARPGRCCLATLLLLALAAGAVVAFLVLGGRRVSDFEKTIEPDSMSIRAATKGQQRNTPESAPSPMAAPKPRPKPAPTPATASIPATALPLLARKPRPRSPGFEGCPAQGDGGDRALNALKNRVDSAAWIPVSIDALLGATWPHAVAGHRRSRWSSTDAAAIARVEGTPVAVEGYLVGARTSGPEATNCHGANDRFRDWHLWLAQRPGRDRRSSIVVETTPAIRATHPEWTIAVLNRLVRAGARVRVSGWLLFDPEHPDQLGKTRGTLWEIHPIMRIEVERGQRWVEVNRVPETP